MILLLACAPPPPTPAEAPTATTAAWQALEGPCAAGGEPGPVPLVEAGAFFMSETEPGGWNMELTDIQLDPDDPGRVLAAGVGGLHAWDATAEGDPALLWKYPESFEIYDRLEVFGGGLVALTARGRPTTLLDAGGAEPVPLEAFDVPGAGAMAWSGPVLQVLSLEGEAVPVDLADPASPRVQPGTPGLGTPWEGVVVGDRLLVADNALGLAVLSLADPLSPVLEKTLDPGTPLLDLDTDGAFLAAAGGSAGLLLFDVADPADPREVARVDYGAAVLSVALDDGVAWGATMEGVVAVDVADPADPLPLGMLETGSWAMHLDARGNEAWVADWDHVRHVVLDPTVRAPAADPSRSVAWLDDTDRVELRLDNRGAADLVLLGGSVDDPRLDVQVDRLSAPPGEGIAIEVRLEDDGAPLDATLCLATNDPQRPLVEISLASTSDTGSSIAVGEPAPDFALPDLDGATHVLSDQLGSPVVLVFFATWCPACRPELSDLEHLAADLDSEGVPVWAVASLEDEATVAAYAADLGLSAITVLLDEDGAVHDLYTQLDAFPSAAYPEEWVIGSDGRVAYVNNAYEPDELLAVIEEELAEGR